MKKFGFARVVMLMLLIFVLSITPIFAVLHFEDDSVKDKFFGKECELQGVLEIWHIDTFEGGSWSKISFLKKVAKEFEKQNIGLFILITEMTVDEFATALNDGRRPSLISFGYGIGDLVLSYACQLQIDTTNIMDSCIKSGLSQDILLSIPWAYNGYFLFSSKTKLENANVSGGIAQNLANASYTKKLNKKTVEIASVVYGKSLFCDASKSIELPKQHVLERETAFMAYNSFCNGEATILLGTNRDYFRLENKKILGDMPDMILEPIADFTDLMQYFSILEVGDEMKQKYASKYIELALSDGMQQMLCDIGMFSVAKNAIYSEGGLFEFEKQRENLEFANLFTN